MQDDLALVACLDGHPNIHLNHWHVNDATLCVCVVIACLLTDDGGANICGAGCTEGCCIGVHGRKLQQATQAIQPESPSSTV
jgi:hypothetical protein